MEIPKHLNPSALFWSSARPHGAVQTHICVYDSVVALKMNM